MDWLRFLRCINWRLGRDNRIRFWLDEWVEGEVSQKAVPEDICHCTIEKHGY